MRPAPGLDPESGHAQILSLQRRYRGFERGFIGKNLRRRVVNTAHSKQLWVFNPDLIYSTSIQQGGPKRAMKIFYQNVTEPSGLVEKQFMVMDELRLPDYVLRSLHASLKESGYFMPTTARKLQEWDVGLLEY